MKLLARGRESDIFDLGDGRVLRRYNRSGNPAHEARVMEHVRAHGFPVPRVDELRADGLVLERIAGESMVTRLLHEPSGVAEHARTLAGLHRRLHAIAAPAGIAAAGTGTSLLHLDLHPENVLLTSGGPVVIDWTNARAGEAALDVAYTWVIVATSPVPPSLRPLRDAFVQAFLAEFDGEDVRRFLPAACERRLSDENVGGPERRAIRRLAATVGT